MTYRERQAAYELERETLQKQLDDIAFSSGTDASWARRSLKERLGWVEEVIELLSTLEQQEEVVKAAKGWKAVYMEGSMNDRLEAFHKLDAALSALSQTVEPA